MSPSFFIMKKIIFLLFLLFFIFINQVQAQTTLFDGGANALNACNSAADPWRANNAGQCGYWSPDSICGVGLNCYECRYWDGSNYQYCGLFTFTEVGVSCPSGTIADALGACVVPVFCSDGTQAPNNSLSQCPVDCTIRNTLNYSGSLPPSDSFCTDGCSYNISIGTTNTTGWTNATYSPSGNMCAGEPIAELANFQQMNPLNPENCKPDPVTGYLLCVSPDNLNCGTANGIEVCVDVNSDPDCGLIDGQLYCASDEKNCGVINGQTVCMQKSNPNDVGGPQNSAPKGCIQMGSKIVCVNDTVKTQKEEKTKIEQIDPNTTKTTVTKTESDNVNGNTTKSSNTVTTTYKDPVTGEVIKTTQESKDKNKCDTAEENCEDFKEIIEDAPAADSYSVSSGLTGEIDKFSTAADDFTGTIGNNLGAYGVESSLGLDNTLIGAFSSGTCTDLVLPSFPMFPGYTFACSDMSTIRSVFGWLLYILTAFFLFDIVTSSSRKTA